MEPDLIAGARLFNAGEWWEAHEAWEAVWMTATGERRMFVQALILLAAALHKRWKHGSLAGRNFIKAQVYLRRLPAEYGGVNLVQLEADVAAALEQAGVLPQLRV